VSQLPRGDEHCVHKLLYWLIACLGFRQDLADEVDWRWTG
jgi:hypothetical protein